MTNPPTPETHCDIVTLDELEYEKLEDPLLSLIERLQDLHNQGYRTFGGELDVIRESLETHEQMLARLRNEAKLVLNLIKDREWSRDDYQTKADNLRATYNEKIELLKQLEEQNQAT